jgi:hypothetical protein
MSLPLKSRGAARLGNAKGSSNDTSTHTDKKLHHGNRQKKGGKIKKKRESTRSLDLFDYTVQVCICTCKILLEERMTNRLSGSQKHSACVGSIEVFLVNIEQTTKENETDLKMTFRKEKKKNISKNKNEPNQI